VKLSRCYFWISVSVILLLSVSNAMAAQSAYTIGPGDTLEISVWRDESLSRELIVPPDGVISFPLVGDINIISMTVADLRNTMTKKNLATMSQMPP